MNQEAETHPDSGALEAHLRRAHVTPAARYAPGNPAWPSIPSRE